MQPYSWIFEHNLETPNTNSFNFFSSQFRTYGSENSFLSHNDLNLNANTPMASFYNYNPMPAQQQQPKYQMNSQLQTWTKYYPVPHLAHLMNAQPANPYLQQPYLQNLHSKLYTSGFNPSAYHLTQGDTMNLNSPMATAYEPFGYRDSKNQFEGIFSTFLVKFGQTCTIS